MTFTVQEAARHTRATEKTVVFRLGGGCLGVQAQALCVAIRTDWNSSEA